MKIELNAEWTAFLSALISRRVRFLLVGGHAVAGHREPRFTEDLHVFIDATPANAERDALVANKLAAGREKDLIDVALLRRHRSPARKRSAKKAPRRRSVR